MKLKIESHKDSTTRVIEYPLTLAQFVKINFSFLGPIYGVEKTGANKYEIFDGFDGDLVYTVSKAGKNDPVTENGGAND